MAAKNKRRTPVPDPASRATKSGGSPLPRAERDDSSRELVLGGLLVASAWSSLAVLPLTTGSNTGRVIAVLLVTAGWLALVALGWLSPVQRTQRSFAVVAGALSGAIVLSSALSPYASRALTWGSVSFFGAPMWVALALVALCASVALTGARWRGVVAAAVGWVVPSLAVAAYQIAAGAAVNGGFNTGNHFGAMMVAVCGVLAWLAVTSTGSERSAWVGLALGAAAGVVASRSSAALLGLLVSAACAAFVAPGLFGAAGSRTRSVVRLAVFAGAGLFLVALLVGIAAPAALPAPLAAYVRGDVLGTTFQTRVEMWKAAADSFAARPLVGHGADSYHLAAQPYLSRTLFTLEQGSGLLAAPPDPHSLPLLFAAQFGVLGLLAGVAVLVVWARRVMVVPDTEDSSRTLLRRVAASSAVGFLVTMLFVPWAAVLGAFPAVLAGLAVAAPRVPLDSEGLAPAWRAVAGLAAVVFAVLAVMLFSGVLALDAADDAPSAPEAQAGYNRMASAMPGYPYARLLSLHAEGSQLGGSPEALAAWQERVDADPAMRVDATYALMLARDSLDQAYRWGRTDVTWERALLEDAAARFPNAPDLALEQAHAAVLSGDLAAAKEFLDRAEETAFGDTRLPLYRYYVAVAQGDEAQAAKLRAQLEGEYGPKALLDPQTAAVP